MNFIEYVYTQFYKTIKIFLSDSGREYTKSSLVEFFKNKGIISQHTCPHTPIRRKNWHVLETILYLDMLFF